jgi:hypothetical protein
MCVTRTILATVFVAALLSAAQNSQIVAMEEPAGIIFTGMVNASTPKT